MDKALEASAAAARERREEAATARKESRQEWQRNRDHQIALMICGYVQSQLSQQQQCMSHERATKQQSMALHPRSNGLTIEQQRKLMEAAKRKAAPALCTNGDDVDAADPVLRTLPLGCDRNGCLFWKLQTVAVLTGLLQKHILTSKLRTC